MRPTPIRCCLALLLLLGTNVARAQKADAEPGLRRLKRNNGLCGLKFGTLKQRMHLRDTLDVYQTRYYDGPGKYRKLGPYKIKVYSYIFTERNGKEVLSSMILQVSDTSAYDKVAQLLQFRYGPHNLGSISQIWKTSTVVMNYRLNWGRIRIFRDDWSDAYYHSR